MSESQSQSTSSIDLLTDTSKIKEWRSIVTLIVFILTNIIVLFPFHLPIFVPRPLRNGFLDVLAHLRVIPPRGERCQTRRYSSLPAVADQPVTRTRAFVQLDFPVNFVTAPLIADLFLLAISAIGRQEVHDGTIGANNIEPYDILAFFLTLAYIAISIDASGLIRFLAFKVLQWGGKVGHKLFFFLYAFFFGLGSFIGNDPIILSGTAFLAYMTRVSRNITHPRAWIHTQFAVANISSAILVSSNPTNLVLAGAFKISFIGYTANMIVPVIVTAIVLFPFLLYIVFADESLIPLSIKMHELNEEAKKRKPVNPNIPNARGNAGEQEMMESANNEQSKLLSLEEILHPFVDRSGAAFGAIIMTATLVAILAVNAAGSSIGRHVPIVLITLPAAGVMLLWDLGSGWCNRHETREIARKGREDIENARREREHQNSQAARELEDETRSTSTSHEQGTPPSRDAIIEKSNLANEEIQHLKSTSDQDGENQHPRGLSPVDTNGPLSSSNGAPNLPQSDVLGPAFGEKIDEKTPSSRELEPDSELAANPDNQPATLASMVEYAHRWSQETFPTVTAVFTHLPFALVPFAFAMFVLVQGLVTKGWVPVFAEIWDQWVNKTGTVGAVGGMGFTSVILCNLAGTNIGATILLSRIIQAWVAIHTKNGLPISDRTFWATVYSMALGVNYGAFSVVFGASLAGLLWRDILARKHIRVGRVEFARVNLPIIAIAMSVGCAVLIGEIYIIRTDEPFVLASVVDT